MSDSASAARNRSPLAETKTAQSHSGALRPASDAPAARGPGHAAPAHVGSQTQPPLDARTSRSTSDAPRISPAANTFDVTSQTLMTDIGKWAGAVAGVRDEQIVYLGPNGRLQFVKPAEPARVGNKSAEPLVLIRAIANDMAASDPEPGPPSEYRELAVGLVSRSFPENGPVTLGGIKRIGALTQAACSTTQQKIIAFEARVRAAQERMSLTPRNNTIWDDREPAAPFTALLNREAHEVRSQANLLLYLDTLTKYIRGQAAGTDIHGAIGSIDKLPHVQRAFVEACRDALEGADAAPKLIAGLLARVTPLSCEEIFLSEHAFKRLVAGRRGLPEGQRAKVDPQMEILRRNSQRYESFRKNCPWAMAPSLQGASRGFLLQMFDRQQGTHASLDASADEEEEKKHERNAPDVNENAAGGACGEDWLVRDAARRLRLRNTQSGLCSWPDAERSGRSATCTLVSTLDAEQVLELYADSATIAELEKMVRDEHGAQPDASMETKLATLQKNARRMDAFMESEFADDPAFDDVEPATLILWWEAIKDCLHPAQESVSATSVAGPLTLANAVTVHVSDRPSIAAPVRPPAQLGAAATLRPHPKPFELSPNSNRAYPGATGLAAYKAEGKIKHHRRSKLKWLKAADRKAAQMAALYAQMRRAARVDN